MAGSGAPYCSLVNLASHPDGSPILLISRLAVHTKNILADPRVSLMLDERAEGDPLEGARIMLAGTAEQAASSDLSILRRRYLEAHPSAEAFVDFKDFSFFRIRPSGTHLVAGFGRIVDLRPEQFLTRIDDAAALLEAEAGAVAHMNADHRDALNLYATRLLGADAGDWRCSGCDPDGIDLAARFSGSRDRTRRTAQDAGQACRGGAVQNLEWPPKATYCASRKFASAPQHAFAAHFPSELNFAGCQSG
jgi:putative heme iron utilization protein